MVEPAEVDAAILAYYASGREKARLETLCRLEFLRTQELLSRFLPRPPASILDVGGGAGIHALPLIAAGYELTLVDPVGLHVEQARASGVEQAAVGDARTLQFSSESFDAVLLLGPLYHLPQRGDRLTALQEAKRVLRPGAVLFAAAISRFASTYDGLHAGFLQDRDFELIVEDDVSTGVHLNPTGRPGWFTTAYMHRPDELAAELQQAGFAVEELLAIEGPGSLISDVDEWLDDDGRREVLMRAIRRVEAEPAILGASSHLLALGRVVPC